MIEIVIVLAIIALALALMAPVFSKGKKAALETESKSRLHQFHLALMQYRMDWGDVAAYGTIQQMGLPDAGTIVRTYLGFPLDFWKSPCGTHPSRGPMVMSYGYYPGDGGPHWLRDVRIYEEATVLMWDINCSDPEVNVESDYMTKKGLGVLLGGNIVTRIKKGFYHQSSWWSEP